MIYLSCLPVGNLEKRKICKRELKPVYLCFKTEQKETGSGTDFFRFFLKQDLGQSVSEPDIRRKDRIEGKNTGVSFPFL